MCFAEPSDELVWSCKPGPELVHHGLTLHQGEAVQGKSGPRERSMWSVGRQRDLLWLHEMRL